MGAFGGRTAKRHRLWSNCEELLQAVIDKGGRASFEITHRVTFMWTIYKYKKREREIYIYIDMCVW